MTAAFDAHTGDLRKNTEALNAVAENLASLGEEMEKGARQAGASATGKAAGRGGAAVATGPAGGKKGFARQVAERLPGVGGMLRAGLAGGAVAGVAAAGAAAGAAGIAGLNQMARGGTFGEGVGALASQAAAAIPFAGHEAGIKTRTAEAAVGGAFGALGELAAAGVPISDSLKKEVFNVHAQREGRKEILKEDLKKLGTRFASEGSPFGIGPVLEVEQARWEANRRQQAGAAR